MQVRTFAVHLNGIPQTIPACPAPPASPVYHDVQWNVETEGQDCFNLATGTFHPPAGHVIFNAGIWVRWSPELTPQAAWQVTGKIWDNAPRDLAAGICARGGYAWTMPAAWGRSKATDGSRVFKMGVHSTIPYPVTLDGDDAHTWWSGTWIGEEWPEDWPEA